MDLSTHWNSFLKHQAKCVLSIQNKFDEDNPIFDKISKLTDTSYTIAILFPVFASLDTKLGYQVLLVSSITEWTSTLLKWALAEGRPYWWVQENNVDIHLRQTELTCETSPGSPAGQVMGTAALAYVFLQWLTEWFSKNIPQQRLQIRRLLKIILWSVYGAIVGLVSLSRIIIAAQFPHQCILGAALGYQLSKLLVQDSKWSLWTWIYKLSKAKTFCLSLFLSVLSVTAFYTHQLLDYDPGWSIKLAFKWCYQPTTVNVYTTPIYSLVRDAGCFVGIGLANPIKERVFYPIVGATVTSLFFVATRLLRPMMPTNDAFQFYLFNFLDNVFISVCLLTIIPYLASLVKIKEKKK